MEDTAIIKKIQQGKIELFDQLIEKYYQKIYSYCYRYVEHRETAQDLTQDVFLKVVDKIGKYGHYGKFENYLYVVAHNKCMDYFKKQKPVYMEEIEIEETSHMAEQVEHEVTVQSALAKLSEVEREVVLLRFYQDLKFKDIAKIMNATVSATKYRLNAAMKKLREILEE